MTGIGRKMKYEIRYKCTYTPGWTLFPVLAIRYRKVGSLRWYKIERELDEYAASKCFYNSNVTMWLQHMDTEERADMFQTVLNERFNGSMPEYVKKIVKDIIMDEIQNQQERDYTAKLIGGWITNGWETIELGISEKSDSENS